MVESIQTKMTTDLVTLVMLENSYGKRLRVILCTVVQRIAQLLGT